MRTTALFMILFVFFGMTSAQGTPEEISKSFFDLVGQKKYSEAVQSLPASKQLEADTALNTRLLVKLKGLGMKDGEYCGFELITKEEVSPSYVVLTYFIKYMDVPQRIQLTFYKPKDVWQVIQVSLNIQSRHSMMGRKQNARQ